MLVLRFLVGLWLFFAPGARAQRVVVPVEGLGRTILAAPAPMISAPFMPAASMPSAPALPVSAAPSLAAPLKLAAVNAAVAQFAAIDLKSAPADDLRGGADALMARVLGVEAPDAPALALGSLSAAEIGLPPSAPESARAPASGPRVHLLSKPLHETVELGPVARALHYILETGFQFVKAAIAWHATGSPAAGLGVLAVDLIKMPPMITAQSLADLGVRYWWRKLSTLKRLADTPGVTRIRVLTTGEAEFSGILARRKENTGLVFMDSMGLLPATIPGFGAPIAVADLAGRRVRLVMIHEGIAGELSWTPTLAELLSGAPIPADIAAAWRARLDADKKDKTPLQRVFDFQKEKELRVEAHLSDGEGGESPLGTIAFGSSVKRLVGLGRLDRVGALFGRRPAARAIPLSDTIVERGGARHVHGAVRRAWRRLTGE
ncbi:MAG: hypothetical protein ABL955_05815, partial [Elusimicrobiota bacterium]